MDAVKDPDAEDYYSVVWRLDPGETIALVEWSIAGPDEGLALGTGDHAPTNDDTAATCWLVGGTPGEDYELTCRVTTNTGRIPNDKTLVIGVRQT